ncbi:MAG: NAD(P)/FAD-dependent oxidoreductase [Ekhidna sp.]|nr:NAD(P)/FAD-dependent oxidoreductase [Ekhidna sp.]
MIDISVIGGGLAGLINAILLNRAGLSVILFEEKRYPFHRVCGEYISNEVIPFLKKQDLFPTEFNPSDIKRFHLSSISGKSLKMPLDLGGFGVSRYSFDHWLAMLAEREGVKIIHRRVNRIDFDDDTFRLQDKEGDNYLSKIAIGAVGKRSLLDKNLNRPFFSKKSPYVGVKYHIKTDRVGEDVIALHNFKGGYCGVSRIENDTFNLCYLSHREGIRKYGSLEDMENQTVKKNPFLKEIFNSSDFLFEKPLVINEITFQKKEPVFRHILMSGDAAGMITPLCGNGMAMAIHSSKVLSEMIVENWNRGFNRDELETMYTRKWNILFANRLLAGRSIQKLFGAPLTSEFAVKAGQTFRPFANYLMGKTHGKPFS